MANGYVLVLEDDELLRRIVVERLSREGYEVVGVGTLAAARELIARRPPDMALLDVMLPDGRGPELLAELVRETEAACVMMTAHATVADAVAALQLGARDYLEKPFSLDRLTASVAAALEVGALRREVRELRRQSVGASAGIIGSSPAMRRLLDLVERLAPADTTTVLIQGETGTGKGVIAQAIHRLSPRAGGPFITVTCSALAETLMESELFGHEKGAFTDARTMKRGLVEVAERGTLFLDEIGELGLRVQGKLLQFIEERTFRRLGSTRDMRVDARIVAATNRDLEVEVREGRFREDLYYRLRVVPLLLPPLRDRPQDIAPLVKLFIDRFNREFSKRVRGAEPEALALLERYPWPGNVRELRNVVERSVLLSDDALLQVGDLPPEVGQPRPAEKAPMVELGPDGLDMDTLERTLLERALQRAGGNRTAAGELLGMSRHQIRNRLKKYGLTP
jgi:two-component system, NtrC family, response regulator AtoC